MLAPLPEGIGGHFGPELCRFVLMHCHQGQSTLPRLMTLYQAPKLLTHEEWVNGAWYKALFGAPPPANPVRNTRRPNDWKSQSFGRLVLLQSLGVSISKCQVQRLLTEKHDDFIAEAQDVLRAGLETAPFVSVDDTGARHAGQNG